MSANNSTDDQSGITDTNDQKTNKTPSDAGPLMQLHVWDYRYSSWISLKKALATRSKKKIINKSTLITSKKYGGLDQNEIVMYQIIEKTLYVVHKLIIPHDLLMIILVYSQGYKFDDNDNCVTFPTGIFGASEHCKILKVIEDNKKGELYFMQRLKDGSGKKKYGGKLRIPFHHTFGNKLIVINKEQFYLQYKQYGKRFKIKYGSVLDVCRIEPFQTKIYSKKKKRDILRMKMQFHCFILTDTIQKRPPKFSYDRWSGNYEEAPIIVTYDSNVFVQAKWKKVDR